MKLLIAISTLLLTSQLHASGIYKTTDKDGNVIYTDSPSSSETTEKVDLPPLTTIPTTSTRSYRGDLKNRNEEAGEKYQSLKVVEPANDSTVRDNGNFTIQVSSTPRLFTGDKFHLKINGIDQGPAQRSPVFVIENMDRGTQKLDISIISPDGKIVKSASSTVHIQRPVFRPAAQ